MRTTDPKNTYLGIHVPHKIPQLRGTLEQYEQELPDTPSAPLPEDTAETPKISSYYERIKRAGGSKLKTELQEQQRRVIERLRDQPGLVVAHGLGSGKTLASIAAAVELGKKNKALVPASLQENYRKEVAKHVSGSSPVEIGSAQRAALRMQEEKLDPVDLLILDEAHRARESTTNLYKLMKDYPAKRKMLLTASPVYNRPSDIATLVNMAAGNRMLPQGTDFDKDFVQKPQNSVLRSLFFGADKTKLKNTKHLKNILNKWVDYHPSVGDDFPDRVDEVVEVPMNKKQTRIHEAARGQLPLALRLRLRAGLPPEKKDLARINAFQSQARQAGGSLKRFSTEGETKASPKIETAIGDLKANIDNNKRHKAVVYSNYLDTLNDYGKELESKKIPYATFMGNMSAKEKKKAIDDYNAGNIKALLVSSAGGEGLDLKGTRQLQVLEPHWNEEKLKQVIGRAIRKGSHTHLPVDEQNVKVQRFLSHPRSGFIGRMFGSKKPGIDNYLYDMSKDKEQLNQQLIRLLERGDTMKKTANYFDFIKKAGTDELKQRHSDESHEQQMRFNEEKHQLEMQKEQLRLQVEHAKAMQAMEPSPEEQQAAQQAEQQKAPAEAAQAAQQRVQHRANMLQSMQPPAEEQ
jgi:SNF2 family DNA or RNA helicase